MSELRKKYDLPPFHRMETPVFDISRLRDEADKIAHQYVDVLASNRALCSNNHSLVESVYDHFEQINLTVFDPNAMIPDYEACKADGENAGTDRIMSRSQAYRLKGSRRVDRPDLDEHNYHHPTDLYMGSYFQDCINQFRSKAIRVRLVKLKAGRKLTPHIDYDPSYAVRMIIPLYTHPDCHNVSWLRGEEIRFHLPADGHAYFLNTGLKHSVENDSEVDRISLMVSLADQADLEEVH